MYTQFLSMWDEYLGRNSINKHRVKLLPSLNPVRLALYQSGSAVHYIQQTEIEIMLSQEIMEAAQTKGAAPVYLR